MPEVISCKTIDNIKITGDWVAAPTTFGAVILLHMMPADRKSWAAFQVMLAKQGLASLAIDLRGHGDSVESADGARYDYEVFSDEEHQSSILDVIGAFDWIKRRGFKADKVAVCGASIGANLALQFLAEEPELAGAALLSPGADYHGINALEDVEKVLPSQALWAAASAGDDQPSFNTAQKMIAAAESDKKEFVELKNAGHGTAMLESHPETAAALADWLKDVIQGG
ncbi:alpha/beta fold hydrolase [Patescibacteria group bacterium]|nr:alpha/beta fold hydrolase [Patescibacteria group bacterium]MBU1034635.1 alpha/beta fold hydrolase [Patescibacteria group bacterium]MBU1629491.1 alpha/beta fold hydrolase [Patescibacteria group bacterium]MBU1908251.1 alpha/beta fold hydrolase [Patescibacteria group bacterium]